MVDKKCYFRHSSEAAMGGSTSSEATMSSLKYVLHILTRYSLRISAINDVKQAAMHMKTNRTQFYFNYIVTIHFVPQNPN